jgi:hypothetical protein
VGIRIIKEKKSRDYTFIDDRLNLDNSVEKKDSTIQKGGIDRDYRLRDVKLNKLKHKSKITGGHNMQGHSAVYE